MGAPEQFQSKIKVPITKTTAAGEDFIVVLEAHAAWKAHVWETLFRVRPDGSVVWKLVGPGSSESGTKPSGR